ncbi:hypothetical protein AtubIFM57258_001945 [Aspergillus tubingensis]|nr:hypothetical protein AtubIFM57258_001945 [Aspergillus tubingensis]
MSTTTIPHPSKARPIVVIGAGILGRRIAAVFSSAGYTVHISDPSSSALDSARTYVSTHIHEFTTHTTTSHPSSAGQISTFTSIPEAVATAWLVIEAVPEILPLKKTLFADLHAHSPADCILASNSSSYKSRLIGGHLPLSRRVLLLNMHFTMPPSIRTVELMTCGETDERVFPMLSEVLSECGVIPVTARKESTGFIFNRLWAAIKREILLILAEGVSEPKEIDLLWEEMFGRKESLPPCRLMDAVGLDTVADIEENYVRERGMDGRSTVDWVREKYVSVGRVGKKADEGLGGLYPPPDLTEDVKGKKVVGEAPLLYLLDVGLGANTSDIEKVSTAGRILKFQPGTTGMAPVTIISGQSLPDGIDVSQTTGRIFWTNMGQSTSTHDGSVHSATLDGQDICTLLPAGAVHTPKQLVVDDTTQHVYFCDREGMSVHRVRFDGSGHEVLVRTGALDDATHRGDMTRWCVGIALDRKNRHVYWTQKGPSKGGKGRIFRAGLEVPAGQTADGREDVEMVLEGLPEPIDLEFDEEEGMLYWTDRGEHPWGCSMNRVKVGGEVAVQESREVLARHFNEPIGLKVDRKDKKVYVADLGGSMYCVDLEDGEKKVVWRDEGCYTGVALVSE